MAALVEQVRDLAAKRTRFAALIAQVKAQRDAFEASIADSTTLLNNARTEVAAAEAGLRALAVEYYERTGEKSDIPGVVIKTTKAYDVDEPAALAWAKEKQLCILPERLDLPSIEQMAKVMTLPFVTIRDVPQPNIAKDLEKALAEVVEEAPAGAA